MARVIRADRRSAQLIPGQGADTNAALADGLARLASAVVAYTQTTTEDNESDLASAVRLAIPIAERLVGDAVTATPHAIGRLLAPLLRGLGSVEKLTVEANPSDAQWLIAELERSHPEAGSQLDIRPEPTLARASFRLQSPRGDIDGRLRTRLQLVERTLLHPQASAQEPNL